MRLESRSTARATVAITLLGLVSLGSGGACAQARLDARYVISFARITVGEGTWKINVTDSEYAMAVTGEASGIIRVVASGKGFVTARGLVRGGRLLPTGFASSITSDDGRSDVRMILEDENVKELTARLPPEEEKGRVPVGETDRHGIVDPLSGLVIAAAGRNEVVSAEACRRSLPIFDGLRRYDLRLSFKRLDAAKAEKGYQGPVVVCAIAFQAISGHRADSPLVKYLAGGRDMELWLAPIAGTRLLAPFRLSIAGMLGDMIIRADRFETGYGPDPITNAQ
jgi:hypothetical protein